MLSSIALVGHDQTHERFRCWIGQKTEERLGIGDFTNESS
jgi:hypothetical protein